jgi:hypothetical protein
MHHIALHHLALGLYRLIYARSHGARVGDPKEQVREVLVVHKHQVTRILTLL